MATIDEAIAAINAEITDTDPKAAESKAKALATRLYKEAKAVARVLVARGAGRKGIEQDADHERALADKQRELDEAIARADTAEAETQALRDKAPDYDRQITTLKETHRKALEKVQAELNEERTARTGDQVERAVERFKRHLKGRVEDFVLDAQVIKHRDRFRPGKGGTVDVLALGEEDPLVPEGDEEAEAMLAEQVIEALPPKARIGTGTPGGGTGGGGGGSGGAKQPTRSEAKSKLKRTGQY